MENLSIALSINKVPKNWEDKAYFSLKPLTDWFTDLLLRVAQLSEWTKSLEVPIALWISGLFNPMSFLTAIMQVTSRQHSYPLDYMCLQTDVTNTVQASEIVKASEDGMYIWGYFLEGAAWELGRGSEQGYLTDMQLKDLHPIVPVINVIAKLKENRPIIGYYECPVYVTSMRGQTYVYTAYMKMESEDFDAKKWILSAVALLQSPE